MHFSAHNASTQRSLQQPIVFWIQHIVFSRCGIKNPAFDSRIHLLMAGDIESNPGPANGNAGTICRGCSKTIRKSGGKIISIICGTCSSHFHKSHTRIKTREEQDHAEKHPGSWTCYFCCTSSPPPGQIPPPPTGQVPNEVLPRTACARTQCPNNIKRGDPRVLCGGCSKSYHKKCTGIRTRIA